MSVLNIPADARRAFDALKSGGITVFPNDVGYTIAGGSAGSLQRIFETKQRAPTKLNAMVGDMQIHNDVHMLDSRGREMVSAIVEDYDLPLGCIAPYRSEHLLIKALDPAAVTGSTKEGTIAMLINAGPFHAEICKLSRAESFPIFGSSCNFTNTGTKFRVEDIPQELLALADVVVDYGLRKFHKYQRSATLINFETLEVVRVGSCYELIADVLARHFNVQLPEAV
ncbi:Sua5/YciO/YrdC/YwlC family protein [Pusillimonas sp. ANT_WB101]|uniref:Sua5/YciO/YrdC/YwlC family protein n=1 Tax=Pusillimonas sp. ANT_WB101 TaxID=2597356 RepID=UPI0011EDA3F6|nr:Sua5/YciO/YrdC/YwlC family protein [Pusillimonas sp. ANT_WB101]KAA0892804.1 Sua5/YciO/YrdC/YwlC family protein [Pusillimonas sp. ANT_WB101]